VDSDRANRFSSAILGGFMLCLALLFFPIFIATIHWFVAIDAAGPLPVDAPLPPGARAVVWNKSGYDAWHWGTIQQNPLGFVIWLLTVGVWFALLTIVGRLRLRLMKKPHV
jgi:hypothetical protein